VGNRFLKAMDRLVTKIEEHHKEDNKHHAETAQLMAGYDSKLETIIGWQERTPVEQPIPTPPKQNPTPKPRVKTPPGGFYQFPRPKTRNEDEDD
jgi:hypothetical protein